MMQPKNDTAASSGEQTFLAGEAYQTKLDADQTKLAAEGYHTVLGAQPQVMPNEAAATEDDQELYRIGDYIADRYEVLGIHRGAWGVVYGTYDHEEELPRALKTIQKKYQFDKKLLELFKDEATLWVQLEKHPYIVRAYEVENFNEQSFVITEYISNPQGNDLRSWLGSPRLTLPVGVELALKIVQGMQYAHSKVAGLVHRDLKPANILVDEYAQPYITDFGLVRAAGSDAGTPAYMAPEQWRKEAVTVQTDIYAFGCILYEILTGHRMYTATAVDEWRYMHLMQFPVAPCMLKPEIPTGLEEFVLRCLEKEPDRRPCDWDEIVEALAGWSYQLTGERPVLDFSTYKLDAGELLTAGASLATLERFNEALNCYNRSLEINPDVSNCWLNKGLSLSHLERHSEAIESFEQAISLDPDDFIAWRSKAYSLIELGRYQEAVDCVDRTLELNPADDEAWSRRGRALYSLERYEEAISACDRALASNQHNCDAWTYKLEALGELDGWEGTLPLYDQALEFFPERSDLWKGKGRAFNELKRYEEALPYLDRAIEICPEHYPALLCKGIALYKLKRYEEALNCYNRALKFDPDNDISWYTVGVILDHLGRYIEAVQAFENALKLAPKYASHFGGKARTLYHMGRYEEAVVSCDQALAIKPENSWGLEYKGKCLVKLNRIAEGTACLKKLQELDPELDIWDDFSENITL